MLEYAFMQRGLLAGLLLGAVIPLVGMTVVRRRLSMIGDALSHASLAGVATGLVGGVSPVAGAIVACLVGALCIEGVRRRVREQSELAVAIILAAGVGIAGVLSGFVPNASGLNSYLFGSILTMSNVEVTTIIAVCAVAVVACYALRRSLFLMSFDERQARTVGVPVGGGQPCLHGGGCPDSGRGVAHGGLAYRLIDDGGSRCLWPGAGTELAAGMPTLKHCRRAGQRTWACRLLLPRAAAGRHHSSCGNRTPAGCVCRQAVGKGSISPPLPAHRYSRKRRAARGSAPSR